MNSYEEKQEARRERYEAKAAQAVSASNGATERSRAATAGIPFGQPILVGHHSEKHHRAAIKRSDNAMRKALDEQEKAEHYAQKAASVGKGGISSDDPDVVVKLKEKLAKLEERREAYKAHNRKARKEGTETLPSYVLTNLGANIRRIKQRIESLKASASEPGRGPVVGKGYRIEEDKDDNRIRFYFDERPDRETCKKMKQAGFRFSRYHTAWQRHLNNAGRYAAERMAKELFGKEDSDDSRRLNNDSAQVRR